MAEFREYPGNSNKAKTEQTEKEERRVKKVVDGKVKTKRNEGRKLANIFISEDASQVKSYVFMDVLVPAIKKAISDIVTDGIDMILYGGKSDKGGRTGGTKVSYRNYYDDRRGDTRDRYRDSRDRFDYDDLVFESRGEAEAVRDEMFNMLERYGVATVADMYDAAGLVAPFTSNRYGWTSLRTSEIVRTRGGDYVIKLPKAMPID